MTAARKTHDLAIARTCRTLAALELTAAAWLADGYPWWTAAAVAVFAPSLLFVDARCRAAHHRARAEAQRTARIDAGEQVPPLVPCCSFWRHSHGEVHGPDCAQPRPPLPRRDTYRLDDAGRAAFQEITRHYDHGTAA
jgi:hypothetical protein